MEQISALMDGELDEREAEREVARLKAEDARERWDEFHLISDALRGEPLLSPRFNESLSRRLAEEPTVLAPQRRTPRARRMTTYAMSAAASVSAAALVAWVALGPAPVSDQLAKAPAAKGEDASAASPQLANVPSDGRMNEYLLAHEGFSPSTALQGVAPYIRTVSATRPMASR
jgi:sigma-E factor negative regulatory protein RseA